MFDVVHQSRAAGIDLLRVLGLVAVVAGHVWTDHGVVRSALYSWHVPLFFFLAGYFWTAGRSLRSEAIARARSLLVPYALWLLLVGTVWLAVARPGRDGPLALVAPVLGGKYASAPFSAFWFVTALCTCAVLRRLLERFPAPVRWSVAVLGIIGATVAPELVSAVPLGVGTAFPALAFLLLGETFRHVAADVRRPVVTGIGLLTGSGIALAAGVRPLDVKQADLGTPIASVVVATAICCGLVLLARAVETLLPASWQRATGRLAACGIGVVLSHALVLWLMPQDVPDVLAFLAALVLPWAAALALGRSRTAGWTVGTAPRRGRRVAVA